MEENKNEDRKCELCKEPAANICYECCLYLCDSCFSYLHEKKANLLHKKEEIDPFISINIKCPEHPTIPMNLFCSKEKSKKYLFIILYIEIFCSLCCFNNEHDKSHNIINIKDEKSLNNCGISYKSSVSEFEFIFQKAKNIKEKIETEIETLNISHKAKINEITEYYKYQCNYLDEKVTEMKNELNKFLKEANNVVLSCENILKATKKSNIRNDNYEIKTLFYISEIYKNNENAKNFFKKPIRNLNLNLGTFSNNSSHFGSSMYNYSYYCFSGITIPKNISVYKNMNKKLVISWTIDPLKTLDLKKYNLQIKINEEEFNYETNSENFELVEYDENDLYEIKIRLCINDIYGEWSETKKFKINELEKGNSLFGGGLFGNQTKTSFINIQNKDNNKKNENTGGGLFANINLFNKSIFDSEKNKELGGKTNLILNSGKDKNDKKIEGFFGKNNSIFNLLSHNDEKKGEKFDNESLFENNNKKLNSSSDNIIEEKEKEKKRENFFGVKI